MMWHAGKSVVGIVVSLALLFASQGALAQAGKAVARVDGQPISAADLDRLFKSRRVDPELQPKVRAEFIDQLIDSRLMQKF